MKIQHKYPIGQLVILNTWGDHWCLGGVWRQDEKEIVTGIQGQIKAIVVGHNRDCDGTPLYFLSSDPIGYVVNHPDNFNQHIKYRRWTHFFIHGIGEESLEACEGETIAMKHESIFAFEEQMRKDLGVV